MAANGRTDRATQLRLRTRVLRRQPEKVHRVDADDLRRLQLLGLAYAARLGRVHAVDAGLATGHHGIHHGLSLISPASDGRRGTEFKIIWMGDDAQRGVPRLVDRFEIWHAA